MNHMPSNKIKEYRKKISFYYKDNEVSYRDLLVR